MSQLVNVSLARAGSLRKDERISGNLCTWVFSNPFALDGLVSQQEPSVAQGGHVLETIHRDTPLMVDDAAGEKHSTLLSITQIILTSVFQESHLLGNMSIGCRCLWRQVYCASLCATEQHQRGHRSRALGQLSFYACLTVHSLLSLSSGSSVRAILLQWPTPA